LFVSQILLHRACSEYPYHASPPLTRLPPSVSYSFLSFYSHGAPRDLHSFPTRRSSDLRLGRPASSCSRRRCRRSAPGAHSSIRTDRKSTRLNSSHQIISYAVFCLKKKTRIHRDVRLDDRGDRRGHRGRRRAEDDVKGGR